MPEDKTDFAHDVAGDLDRLIAGYLAWLEHNRGRAPRTIERYQAHLTGLKVSLASAGKGLLEASLEDLERFAGIEAHRRGISPRSRKQIVSALRGFYGWARRSGLMGTDPSLQLPTPKAGEPLPKALTLKQAEALLMAPDISTFRGLRDATMMALLIGCGLRVSGVVALNEEDLQWVQYEGKEWLVLRVREKGKKDRLVPAPHEARLLMRAYLGHGDRGLYNLVTSGGQHVLFISTSRSGSVEAHDWHGEAIRVRTRRVQYIVEKYGKKAGIARNVLHPHAARHLYGTELAEDGTDLLQIQALMGHADPKTTKIYVRLAMRRLAGQVDKANPLRKMRTPVTALLERLSSS